MIMCEDEFVMVPYIVIHLTFVKNVDAPAT